MSTCGTQGKKPQQIHAGFKQHALGCRCRWYCHLLMVAVHHPLHHLNVQEMSDYTEAKLESTGEMLDCLLAMLVSRQEMQDCPLEM